MAGPNFPSLGNLADMEFMSPAAYQQAQQQIGLANQFAQQGLTQGNLANEAQSLRNIYDTQMNPMKIRAQELDNDYGMMKNMGMGVDTRIKMDTEKESKEAARKKFLAAASEDELKQLQAQGEALSLRIDDPAAQARGNKMRQASWDEQKRRAAAADRLKETEAIVAGRDSVAATNASARTDSATIAANARLAAQQQKDAARAASANGNPKNAEQAAVRYQMEAEEATDPAERARLLDMAKRFGQYSMALKNASAGTKPDLAQFGITTNPVNMGVGAVPDGLRPRVTTPAQFSTNGNERVSTTNAAGEFAGDLSSYVTPQEAVGMIAEAKRNLVAAKPADRPAIQDYINQLQTVANKAQAPVQQPAAQPAAKPAVSQLPEGSKQIGTSGGRPVYETPDGKRFIGK